MGFFSDFLFGEPSSAEFKTMDTLLPEQKAALQRLIPRLESRTLNQNQTQSLQGLEEVALARARGSFGNETSDKALQELISGKASDFDSYFDTAVRDPLLEDFNELISPAIIKNFSSPNSFWSSERVNAEAQSRDDLFKQLSRARAETAFQTQEAAKGRQVQGLQLQAGLQESVPELLKTRFGLDDAMIAALMSALGIQGQENIGIAKQGREGAMGEILAAIAGGVAKGAAGSDKRIKRNIKRIGELSTGVPLYLFQYLWSSAWYRGVMAQELMTVQPKAVLVMGDVLAVDYSKVVGWHQY